MTSPHPFDMTRAPAHATTGRRRALHALAGGAAWLSMPAIGHATLPAMTEGPFYPPPSYRARQLDWDADLTQVQRPAGEAAAGALGEWLDLGGQVLDPRGRPIDRAEVEIWQCDVHGSYRHPRGEGRAVDAGFQGFGLSRSDEAGRYRFRTIKPTPYPGRCPHIHVRVRHPSLGEWTSQLFVAGDPANLRDGLYRRLDADERKDVDMRLGRAPAGAPVVWVADHPLVIGR